ncbi:MAG: lipoyl synthase [Clostridiales Family XIII bacterium]|jgi:lipoic acid synthetase|nr:lipoyl synthase [Clostridiales Family XIII bacterium]
MKGYTEVADNAAARKPEWLRKRFSLDEDTEFTGGVLEDLRLNTVCREAMCPNYTDCFSRRTATFMILGTNCTRDCAFCNVAHGEPSGVDADEPARVGEAVARLGLKYVVVTSVTRDDLPDGGAGQFAGVIRSIRERSPGTAVEVLVPDFGGSLEALRTVASAAPDVISHNMETVKELYQAVRPGADYGRSLELIRRIPESAADSTGSRLRSKSGFMVGFGETRAQVYALMDDLLEVGCEFLTIGQYLAPSRAHHRVVEYVTPGTFDEYADAARAKGFAYVASAPFVRSSYRAGEALGEL